MIKKIIFLAILIIAGCRVFATTNPYDLLNKLKEKIEKVNDYIVDAKIKTNVAYIKAPVGSVKVYYKKPNNLKIIKEKGIFILPKSGIDLGINSLLTLSDYDAIDAGVVIIDNFKTRKIRVLPKNTEGDLIIMDVYIDEKNLLLIKSTITTKENGSYDISMTYGKYKDLMLPDVMKINFNVNAYKIPKSISMDFDEKLSDKETQKLKTKKGQVDFYYSNYKVNTGIKDAIFK